MDIKKGDILELRVEKIVYGGRGLAYRNEMAIFVEQAIPGDIVEARIFRVKKNFAEARLVRVIEPSPHRIIAPCPYSGYCGGCKWQFIEYDKQLEYKRLFVEELLYHIGKTENFQVHSTIPSFKEFGYRNKMEFSFSERRWLLPEEKQEGVENNDIALGLHVPGTFSKVIDIEGCLLQKEMGNDILQAVKGYVKNSKIPVYGLKSHQGFWRYLMLRHSYYFNEWMVNIVTNGQRDDIIQDMASALKKRFKEISSVVNNVNARRGGTAFGEMEKIISGKRTIKDKIGTFVFEISANSFFQTNTPTAEKLYQKVKDFSCLTGKETVLTLYCGTGTDSIFLAPDASRVIGIDISESAIVNAKRNCDLNSIDNCEFLCGDVKTLLSQINAPIDLLVTDPPRAGMHKKVIEQILIMLPEKIIYISCNPATLARDVALMLDIYRVKEVLPVDLFPHTYHIESIVRLEKV